MSAQALLSERRVELLSGLREDFNDAPIHSKGFVFRLLGLEGTKKLLQIDWFDLSSFSEKAKYEGFPYLAYLGFAMGAGFKSSLELPVIDVFILGLTRLQERKRDRLEEFLEDDVAILGVADGISMLITGQTQFAPTLKKWLVGFLK